MWIRKYDMLTTNKSKERCIICHEQIASNLYVYLIYLGYDIIAINQETWFIAKDALVVKRFGFIWVDLCYTLST